MKIKLLKQAVLASLTYRGRKSYQDFKLEITENRDQLQEQYLKWKSNSSNSANTVFNGEIKNKHITSKFIVSNEKGLLSTRTVKTIEHKLGNMYFHRHTEDIHKKVVTKLSSIINNFRPQNNRECISEEPYIKKHIVDVKYLPFYILGLIHTSEHNIKEGCAESEATLDHSSYEFSAFWENTSVDLNKHISQVMIVGEHNMIIS